MQEPADPGTGKPGVDNYKQGKAGLGASRHSHRQSKEWTNRCHSVGTAALLQGKMKETLR